VKWTVLLFGVLAGCAHTHSEVSHSEVSIGAGTPHSGVQAHIEGGRGLAALLGLSILAAGIVETERARYSANPFVTVSESNSREAPPMAPDRRVSEQDCTQPLDYSLGNIRCK
jgi:hypothetical protein